MNAERLAAYLAGELDPDETAALEAALVEDPRLRSDLDAIRRADAALAELEPTALPEGFASRLRATIDAELATVLRADEVTPAQRVREQRASDELATRRARRSRSWVPAFAGAAAVVAVIAGTLVGVGVLGGGDDAATDTAADADSESAMTMEADDGAGADEMVGIPGPGEGPTVVAFDRDLDDELADELLTTIELQAIAEQGLDATEGRSLGESWRAALQTAIPATLSSPEEESDEDEAGTFDTDDAMEDAPAAADRTSDIPVRLFADAHEGEALEAADRCLPELLDGSETTAIPAYLELATYDGEAAVIVGLVTFDPATEAYTRPEVWVLSRGDCQPLRFSQG